MTAGWLLRRPGAIVLVLLIVSFTVFTETQILPANAAVMILGEFAAAEQRHAVELAMGLKDPWWQQYLRWAGGILHGDLGMSAGLARPVADLVGDGLGRPVLLAGATLIEVCVIAVPIGVAGTLLRGMVADTVIGVFRLSRRVRSGIHHGDAFAGGGRRRWRLASPPVDSRPWPMAWHLWRGTWCRRWRRCRVLRQSTELGRCHPPHGATRRGG